MPTPIWLDTDIGSNVDDLLALLFIAGSPELNLVGISTVYGDTHLRAQVAQSVVDLLGLDIPVVPGVGEPRSQAPIFWTGHEGRNYGSLPTLSSNPHYIEAIADAANTHAGELVLGGIGPLTNLADVVDQPWGNNIGKYVIMGGRFDGGEPDRNVKSDAVAAADFISRCQVPVDFVGIEICRQVWLSDPDLERMVAQGHKQLRELVTTEVETWWEFKGERRSNPCDPLTLLSLIRPDLFHFKSAPITFTTDGNTPQGTTIVGTHSPSSTPPKSYARYAVDVDVQAARAEITQRISAAISHTHNQL